MVQGIRGSKLLSDMYEGDERNVPIGQRILVNDSEGIADELKPLSTGRALTSLHVDQFDVFGRSRQGKAVKRDPITGEVSFSDRERRNEGLLVEAAFEQEDGLLHLVRQNSELLVVAGFMTQADFGRGATGPRGEPGYDGHDGHDGDDGPDGPVGCEGPKGELGAPGEIGKAGKDGAHGIPGPIGQDGLTGLQGEPGDQGRYGHEGARGRRGPSCLADAGADGADGEALNGNVVISNSAPGDNTVAWGIPVAGGGTGGGDNGGGTGGGDNGGGTGGGDNGGGDNGGGDNDPPPEHCVIPSSATPAAGISFTCNGFNIAGSDMMHGMYDTSQYSTGQGKGMIYNIPLNCCESPLRILRLYNSLGGNSLTLKVHFDHPAGAMYKSVTVPSGEARDLTLDMSDPRWRRNNTVFIDGGGAATLTLIK